jgi:hypothetical protein
MAEATIPMESMALAAFSGQIEKVGICCCVGYHAPQGPGKVMNLGCDLLCRNGG